MADYRSGSGASGSYRSSRGYDPNEYGRGSSFEGGAAYEGTGGAAARRTQYTSVSYRGPDDYARDYGDRGHDSWTGMVGMDNVSALAIGAGLGFLAGWLLTGSSSSSGTRRGVSDASTWSAGSRQAGGIETDETAELIASNKVEGTAVYDRQGNTLGEVQNFMVGKRSGRVAYAVMSFGGLLGVGASYYTLPWSSLDYDTEKGGYVVDLDKDRLAQAPNHRSYETPFDNPDYGRRVTEYWSSSSAGAGGF